MSNHTPARLPAGVTAGGQFVASARAESAVTLGVEPPADRQARIAAAIWEASIVAESYGSADLRGVLARAEFGVNLSEYVQEVRTLQGNDAWYGGDVDTASLLDQGLALLAETGAHDQLVTRIRRERFSERFLEGDPDPAGLVDDVTGLLETHLALQDAVLHSPLAGSEQLVRPRYQREPTGAPTVMLAHTEFVAAAGGRQHVTAARTPAGTVDLWAGGQRVVGLGERPIWSAIATRAASQRPAAAAAALAAVLDSIP
ncbi:hypothetical protein JOE63_002594 [Cellulosimicrobium cellulans]|uniref:hypothetical protein n=1 Tax=Cellulosimicrobium cellulans TaxID=1710 RepID=UPI0019587DA2|nr:hypothetical protein [Cellulosimicrobium cellulans]MBM7820117.1 hypothetical protein [Cellulosimicrobium cellulans]